MGMPKYAKQRDANEPAIVKELKQIGCSVVRGDLVDLIVGYRGRSWLFEIKFPGKRNRLQPSQVELKCNFLGQYDIIETSAEAMKIMGAIR